METTRAETLRNTLIIINSNTAKQHITLTIKTNSVSHRSTQ